MTASNDILELRFTGNDINPRTVKPSEIAELMIGFERAILSDINYRHPKIDTSELLLVFEEVKDQSLGIRFSPKIRENIVVASFEWVSSSFQTGDFSTLDNATIAELKIFTRFSKRHNCNGEFNLNGKNLSSFTPHIELQPNKNPIIEGETKIFGRVIDSGGDHPNVHLKINDNHTLIFPTSEAIAKELARKLYEKVCLIGTARWDGITYEIKSFKIKHIEDFIPGSTLNAIKELRQLTGGYWDNFNTNDEINNQLQRD